MVLPFKRATTDTVASFSIYGKLPNRADFVRVNANHPVLMELDELIQHAFERLTSEGEWHQSYDHGAAVEFQYVSRDLRYILIGVLKPSRDEAGRRYPFIAGAILPSESVAGYLHVAPIAYEVFFDGLREQVSTAIDNSVEALSCRQFLESHLRTSDTAVADLDLAKSVVLHFMGATTVKQLHDLLATDERSSSLEQALLNIAFYRAFLRRFDNLSTNQIILLPLPKDKGEQPLVASAWLSILNALWHGAKEKQAWRCNFLMLQSPLSGSTMLAACFGKANENLTSMMLGKKMDAPMLLDLSNEQAAWSNHLMYAEVSYALGRVLADPTLSLSGLCEFLQDVGRKLDDSG